MQTRGSVTGRHVAIAVLVMVVVNAQLTWWIIFSTGQARDRLELERRLIVDACRSEAERISDAVKHAEAMVSAVTGSPGWGSSGIWSPSFRPHGELESTLPAPYERWAAVGELVGRAGWHATQGADPLYEFSCPYADGFCGLVVSSEWAGSVLQVDGDIEIRDATGKDSALPCINLPPPFENRVVSPRPAVWNDLLDEYRRRIVMMVSEGAFFAVLLIVFMGLLWRTFRREVELERQHRNFLSAITHELKSPIAAIRLALETVMSGRADEKASRHFIGNAVADADRLDLLVQKVLHATRYGSGGSGIRRSRQSVDRVVERAVSDFVPGATMAGAVVEAEIEPDLWAEVDDEALTIVVSNLLENALKYGGSPARIELRFRRRDDRLILDVTDNGAGIPEEEIPRVFDRFYRAGDEMTRTSQGTGLGLYLVHRIMKAHHGSVEIADSSHQGTTVRATLPGKDVEEKRE